MSQLIYRKREYLFLYMSGLTLSLAIVAICYLKCRRAGYKHCLGGSKITYLGKSVFCSAFGFSNIAFIIPSHFIVVPYFTLDAGFFSILSACQTIWILIWVQTVCKGYQ